jgi:hypothetical protein
MTIGKDCRDDFLQSQTGFLKDVNGVLLNVGGPGSFNIEGLGRSIRLTALSIKGHHLGGRTSLVNGKDKRGQFTSQVH